MRTILYTAIIFISMFQVSLLRAANNYIAPPICNAQFSYSADTNNYLLIHFTNLSSGNAQYWDWDFGDGSFSSQINPSHTYSAAGSYHVVLVIYDSSFSCFDSISQTVQVNQNTTCQANFSFTINSNNPANVQFTDMSTGNITNWAWNFGDSTTSNNQSPSHTYAQSGAYQVSLIASNSSCSDTIIKSVNISLNNQASLLVYAYTDSTYLDQSILYLYQDDSLSGSIQVRDSALSTIYQGVIYYNFQNIPKGMYKVYAKILPTSSSYGLFYDTWMPNSVFWQSANSINVNSHNAYTIIQMAKSTVSYPQGNASISGTVKTKINNAYQASPNVAIYLLLNDSNIIDKTISNQQGEYKFSNLAPGTYYLRPEVIGKASQKKKVIIDANQSDVDSISFVIDGNQIFTAIPSNNIEINSFSIYPNPAKDFVYVRSGLQKNRNIEIKILDLQGRIIYTKNILLSPSEIKIINISELDKGVYIIYLQTNTGTISKKIIKV